MFTQFPKITNRVCYRVSQPYLLRLGLDGVAREYAVLKAMETISLPMPRVYGLDEQGNALGIPCFLSDFIDGEPLLKPLLAGETWAEELFIATVCTLQSIGRDELPTNWRARLLQTYWKKPTDTS